MKTVNDLKSELLSALATCSHVNDGSLAAQVNENIQWAWQNWDIDFKPYFEGENKPERYTALFMEEWIENEDFEVEIARLNEN